MENNTLGIIFTILVALPIVCIILEPIFVRIKKPIDKAIKKRKEARMTLVKNSSIPYGELREIASKYHILYNIPDTITVEHEYKSRQSLNNANLDEMLVYLANNNSVLKSLYIGLCNNREKGSDYFLEAREAVLKLTPISVIQSTYLSEKEYHKIEDQLIKQVFDVKEDVQIVINLAYYTKDRKYKYTRSITTTFKDLQEAHSEAKQRQAIRLKAEIERGKMTEKLRYQVLIRDHKRCVICGRGAEDGVKLHVDHIIPVSKGGKTELSNLRVLCESCNLGKGDMYDPNGIN